MANLEAGNSCRLSLLARAKLNLFLQIHRDVRDGRHELDGLFVSISLADRLDLTVRPTPGVTLHTEFDFDCSPEENLCSRAARSFLERATRPDGSAGGAEIRLLKHIPVMSGLGGGSADAAAVLAGLDALHGHPLGETGLLELGRALGSDVPFCLEGGLAVVSGTGERVRPLPFIPRLHLLVVKPPCSVSTAWAYRAFDGWPDKTERPPDLAGLLAALERGDLAAAAPLLHNGFEAVVEAQFPAIRQAREQLLWAGARAAHLSGSGAAVFGLFDDEVSRQGAYDALSSRYPIWQCHAVTRGLELFVPEEDWP